jgi:hypothetical protein
MWNKRIATKSSFPLAGPGLVYLGIHGGRFLELSNSCFGHRSGFLGSHVELPAEHLQCREEKQEVEPFYCETVRAEVIMSYGVTDSWFLRQIKNTAWYCLGMPIWCGIASQGKECLTAHVTKLAMQTPHPIRIGNVRFARAKILGGDTRVVMMKSDQKDSIHSGESFGVNTKLLRADSLPKNHETMRTADGQVVALPHLKTTCKGVVTMSKDPEKGNYQSINQRVGAMAKRQAEEDTFAIEDDPQQDPPCSTDFIIAIFYVVFGVVAMAAGLISIFIKNTEEA